MKYTNDDRENISNAYGQVLLKEQELREKERKHTIKEENFFDGTEDEADRIDGDLDYSGDEDIIGGGEDLDSDGLGDRLEEKVFTHLEQILGDSFRTQCSEVQNKFDLSEEEFCEFFKAWFDKNHVMSHLQQDSI